MKLAYITQPTDLGGTAVPDCGTIYISELKPTLDKLSADLDLGINLNDFMIGSTGKREYSGDIDLVLRYDAGHKAFHIMLVDKYGLSSTARNGDMIHLKYPIVDFDATKDAAQPRTGFVQIDFNFGDVDWEKVYHYAPGDDSEYKGAHRNLIIAAISSLVDNEKSPILDFYDRPVTHIRWKWGSKGLIKVNRHSVLDNETNEWSRKQFDTNIAGPIFDADQIAKILFPLDGTSKDLHSLETMMGAVKRNYGMADQERIWERTARNFSEWKQGNLFVYPAEISRYFLLNDK